MPRPCEPPAWLHKFVASLGILWGVQSLEKHLTLEFSGRMTRLLGSCRPETATVRLNRTLADPRNAKVLGEVVCHEAAHAVAFLLCGKGCKPHGREWQGLMEAAQYAPRTRIPGKEIHGQRRRGKKRRYRYTHRCLDCGAVFHSGRTDRRWRCKSCLSLGLNGILKLVGREAI